MMFHVLPGNLKNEAFCWSHVYNVFLQLFFSGRYVFDVFVVSSTGRNHVAHVVCTICSLRGKSCAILFVFFFLSQKSCLNSNLKSPGFLDCFSFSSPGSPVLWRKLTPDLLVAWVI